MFLVHRIPSRAVQNTVCLLIQICPPGVNPARRNRPELIHCPAMKEQLDSLKSSDKEYLVLMDQYNIEIFSCCLRLLPLYFSTFHPTNVEIAHDRSKDIPLFSRIQPLHRLLEVDDHDEKEYSVFFF